MFLLVYSVSVFFFFIIGIFMSFSEYLESRKVCLKNNIFG